MAPSAIDLAPKRPEPTFKSDAGTVEVWLPSAVPMLHQAQVGASRLTLYPKGLALPKYSDSSQIHYVLEGSGLVGVVFPETESEIVRKVRRGDVVALPLGTVVWWYNGSTSELSVLSLGDTSKARESGKFTDFHLGEGIGGFSPDFVAQAWDLNEASVEKVLRKNGPLVKVDDNISISEPSTGNEVAASFGEFIFNCEDAKKDVDVKNGGRVSMVSSDNLPILKHIQLGGDLVNLDRGAMCSPGFSPDAAFQVTYVVRGSGRVQVVSNEGYPVVNTEIGGGDFFIVPRFHVVSKRAGEAGLEWFSIITTEKPIFTHLAGRTSVWKALSPGVIRAALNVDGVEEEKIRQGRTKDAIFFPPKV